MAMVSGRHWEITKTFLKRIGRHLFINVGAFFYVIVIITGCADQNFAMAEKQDGNRATKVVGGPCEYRVYQGYARITSIQKHAHKQVGHGGVPYECYEVRFTFHPERKIEEPFARVEGREFTLLLTNGWYPGLGFLQKYAIEPGEVFDCDLHVITKGACTPVIFEFPAIDLSDYKADSKLNDERRYHEKNENK